MRHASLARWEPRIREFAAQFLPSHPAMSALGGHAVLLHGSTTFGIDDACSDLDLWILSTATAVAEFDRRWPTRFLEFELHGKKGHFNIEAIELFSQRVARCDLPLIAELRHAVVISDEQWLANELLIATRRPMQDSVRRAWFCYHYVEMRGEHRACDSPIERGHAVALLVAATKTIEHALRAACVLDGQPYHYSKWLATMAAQTPTGAEIVRLVNECLDLLAANALRAPDPEKQHPLGLKLREIRTALISAARAAGIDEPWLTQWWLHMDKARNGVEDVTW